MGELRLGDSAFSERPSGIVSGGRVNDGQGFPHLSSYVVECGKPNQRKAGGLEAPQSSLEASKSRLEAPKSRPGGSKIEAWRLPNRPKSPPRRHFF